PRSGRPEEITHWVGMGGAVLRSDRKWRKLPCMIRHAASSSPTGVLWKYERGDRKPECHRRTATLSSASPQTDPADVRSVPLSAARSGKALAKPGRALRGAWRAFLRADRESQADSAAPGRPLARGPLPLAPDPLPRAPRPAPRTPDPP